MQHLNLSSCFRRSDVTTYQVYVGIEKNDLPNTIPLPPKTRFHQAASAAKLTPAANALPPPPLRCHHRHTAAAAAANIAFISIVIVVAVIIAVSVIVAVATFC